jgi:phasin family protein
VRKSLVFVCAFEEYVGVGEWGLTYDAWEFEVTKERSSETNGEYIADSSSAFDFATLLGPYSLAGVDYSKILERERKNIAALTEANKIVFEGWRALIRRQSEIFQETMTQTITSARKQDAVKSRADLAKQGFEKALDNMREIASIATKYQHEAFDVVHKRLGENMEELHNTQKAK